MAAGRRKNKEIIMRRGIGLLYFSSHIPEVKGNMVRVPIQQQELCTTFPSSTFATASASLSVILWRSSSYMVLLLYISPSTSYIKILLLYRHLLLARHISKERRQNTHEFRSWGGRQSKMTYIQQQLRWANIPICRRIYKQTLTVYLFFFPRRAFVYNSIAFRPIWLQYWLLLPEFNYLQQPYNIDRFLSLYQ